MPRRSGHADAIQSSKLPQLRKRTRRNIPLLIDVSPSCRRREQRADRGTCPTPDENHGLVLLAVGIVLVHGGRREEGLLRRAQPDCRASVNARCSCSTTSRKQPWLGYSLPSRARISVRNTPPGRTSISQSAVVIGAGAHNFIRCSGVVHAFQMSDRGASTNASRRDRSE
jgi:hypothetical protein